METDNLACYQKKGLKIGADIGFLDESGISLRPTVRRAWTPKGKTPIIKSGTIRWIRRSVIGTIKCSPVGHNPKLYLRIFKSTMGTEEVIRYLKELRRHIKGKLILLWDRLPSHRSKEMKKFLATQKEWLFVEWSSLCSRIKPLGISLVYWQTERFS